MVEAAKGWVELPIDKLVAADWNYKEEDVSLAAKLTANLKRNGQVENIIVRQLDTGFYEVVNGNHRLPVFKELGMERVMCFNLGTVTAAQARRIAIETNETKFDTDTVRLAEVIAEIVEDYPIDELVETMPYDLEELQEYADMAEFDGQHPGDGGDGSEAGTVKLVIWVPQNLYDGTVTEAKQRIEDWLREEGYELHQEPAVAWSQVLEVLCAEYLAGGTTEKEGGD